MTEVARYLDYIASADYERRHRRLADKMARGPVSFADMASTLGLPVAVVCELFNAWRAERTAANSVKH